MQKTSTSAGGKAAETYLDFRRPFHCPECDCTLGYIKRQPVTIDRLRRPMRVLQRIDPFGRAGDLIIGDVDLRCGECGTITRWDYRRS